MMKTTLKVVVYHILAFAAFLWLFGHPFRSLVALTTIFVFISPVLTSLAATLFVYRETDEIKIIEILKGLYFVSFMADIVYLAALTHWFYALPWFDAFTQGAVAAVLIWIMAWLFGQLNLNRVAHSVAENNRKL